MNLSDLTLDPATARIIAAIEAHTLNIARIHMAMVNMTVMEQGDAVLALATEGVKLAKATAALFLVAKERASEIIDTTGVERKAGIAN